MPAAATQTVERVVLSDISWDFYKRLLSELGDSPGTRVTYDNGLLQIMVISAAHEQPNRTLASIVELVCLELGVDVTNEGSTTLQRPDLLKGFEPDSCFYFRHAAAMRGVDDIDLTTHPPPDLVIEVDLTSNSLNRFPIFAAVGVMEVWRHAGGTVTMYALRDGEYHEITSSIVLPVLTAEIVTRFANSGRRTMWPVWARELLDWVRSR